jgi:cation diffusion facilitator family transporter
MNEHSSATKPTSHTPLAQLESERQHVAERTTLVSAIVNVLLSSGQIIIGVLAHSQGLIADGIHSLSDLVADAVVFMANRKSHSGPDEDHQYGHTRYENAASLFLGVLLLVVGAGMLIVGIGKVQHTTGLSTPHIVALWAALIALVAKEGLFRYMLAEAQRIQSTLLIANAWHARSDAASSLVVAVGILGSLLGYPILDPLAAMIVGAMIGRMGWHFAWDALQDLMDRALPPADVAEIQATLAATPGVINVHDLRTRRMGDQTVADAHLEVDPRITVSEGHYIAAQARRRVLAQDATRHIQIHIDPQEIHPTSTQSLPFRHELLTVMNALAPDIMATAPHILLHYLEGTLEVELTHTSVIAHAAHERLQTDLSSHFDKRVVLSVKCITKALN